MVIWQWNEFVFRAIKFPTVTIRVFFSTRWVLAHFYCLLLTKILGMSKKCARLTHVKSHKICSFCSLTWDKVKFTWDKVKLTYLGQGKIFAAAFGGQNSEKYLQNHFTSRRQNRPIINSFRQLAWYEHCTTWRTSSFFVAENRNIEKKFKKLFFRKNEQILKIFLLLFWPKNAFSATKMPPKYFRLPTRNQIQARTVPRTNGGGELGELFWGVNFYCENRVWGGHLGGGRFYRRKLFLEGPRGGPRNFFWGRGVQKNFRKKFFIAKTCHATGIVKGGESPPYLSGLFDFRSFDFLLKIEGNFEFFEKYMNGMENAKFFSQLSHFEQISTYCTP